MYLRVDDSRLPLLPVTREVLDTHILPSRIIITDPYLYLTATLLPSAEIR